MGNCKPRVSCIRISAVNRREPTGAERLNQGLTAFCSHIYARGQCPVLLLPESLEMVPSADRRNSQVTAFRPMGLSGWQSSKNEGCELRVPSSAMTELNSECHGCADGTLQGTWAVSKPHPGPAAIVSCSSSCCLVP